VELLVLNMVEEMLLNSMIMVDYKYKDKVLNDYLDVHLILYSVFILEYLNKLKFHLEINLIVKEILN